MGRDLVILPLLVAALAQGAVPRASPQARLQTPPQAPPQASPRPQPRSAEALAREILGELVAFNTTASTGATTPAANALAARFRAAGFPAADVMVIGGSAKSRNLVVRWRGSAPATAKPLVFAAHLDVVEAPRLEWSTDPWRLTERGGHLYGRGVLDDKGPIAAIAAAVIVARRAGLVPRRDLAFVFTAGEETGIDNGVAWLLANRRPLVDGEFALILDSGGADMVDGRVQSYALQSAEKTYLDLELVARGPGGHSSTPPVETPITRLARAIGRVDAFRFPVRVNGVVRAFLRERAPLMPAGPERDASAALAREPGDLASQSVLLRSDVGHLLRSTCITTMLRAGTAPNAIAQEAVATVNCRLLPGETPESAIATLTREIGDSAIALRVPTPAIASDASIPGEPFLAAFRRVLRATGHDVPIVPYMESGGTDGVYFRNAGIPAFGVNGFYLAAEDYDRMHGRDERISLEQFRKLVRHSQSLLTEFAAFPHAGATR